MDKGNNNLLAACMIEMEIKKLIEQEMVSEQSWEAVNKSKLPRQSFLWVEDPKKKDTWHLPYREGTGGIDPDTGMYREAGAVNLNALRAISAAIEGARTGEKMNVPTEIRSKITKLLKRYKIGRFAERQEGDKAKMQDTLKEFSESVFANSQLRHDPEKCMVFGMAILGSTSKNCSVSNGKGRRYSEQALHSAATLVNGTKSYINHATRKELEDRGGIRDIRDLLGCFENGRVENGIVKADLQYLKCHQPWFSSLVEQMADKVGGSIHAYGPSSYDEKTLLETVQDIKVLNSVDIVTETGSTNNLFESLGRTSENVEIKDITLSVLRESRPDLITSMQKEYEESEQVRKSIKEREDTITTLKENNTKLTLEIDKYKAVEALTAKKEAVMKKVTESKMPKELISDVFIESLMKAGDDKIDALITDRKALSKGKAVTGMGDEKKFDESFSYDTAKIDYGKAIEGFKENTK